MPKLSISHVIQTSIVTAITLTAALVWKDILIELIELFVPPERELLYKIIAVTIITALLIVAIYPLLKTESEAEKIIKKLNHKRKR